MRIAIIGLGLIGGSIGLALKQNPPAGGKLKIIGIPRREETIGLAKQLGAIDEGTTDHVKGVADADLVFICTPIHLIVPVIQQIAPSLKKGMIVTDVGSSKQEIVKQAERAVPRGVLYIGGHPMAGKETSKLEAADPALFQGKTWLLTRTARSSITALEKVGQLAGLMGARVVEMDPRTHDLVVAAISHLPLALAVALVNTVAADPQHQLMGQSASSGFRDTTRVASGDPILGVDLFQTNQKPVLKMIRSFKQALNELEALIKEGNGEKLKAALEKAKQFRDPLYQ
ncbi:MAG: prephenate dehydrogenase/arogenate dehydrogenase family protein [Candidatus Margulisbacteria bacterium]|jgi:prephenate dehydrogenase|nr:prephenate dehydrogenase/arogenate dehydrogenase family protein [Candidatus Margulisiibacteriota bacterium]